MASRLSIKRETVTFAGNLHTRWVARYVNGELYGYSSTWFGAWRLACQAVGWKVPR